jgi:hypothetical protein
MTLDKLKAENEKLQEAFNVMHFDEDCSVELKQKFLEYAAWRKYQAEEMEQGGNYGNT